MRYLLVFLINMSFFGAIAQKDNVYDTAKRLDPLSTDMNTLNRSFNFKTPVDSGMLYFQQYDFLKRNNVAVQDLGDVATPYMNSMFQPIVTTGLITGFNPYGDHYYYQKNAKFYQAKLPFTTFYYVQGKAGQFGRGLINFDATHTQNIGERFNFAVNFHSTTNEGFYQQNSNNMKNIQITDYYRSKNKRYLASMILTWNKTIFSENGGIYETKANDSLFRNITSNLRYVPMELVSGRNINRFRDLQLSQTFWIKGKYSNDSLRNFTPQIGICYGINHQKQSNYYTDNAPDFNNHIYDSVYYFNSTYSADSMRYSSFGNSFEIFTPYLENGVSFSAGAKYEKLNYFQEANAYNYHLNNTHNASVFGQFNFNFIKKFKSDLKGNFFVSGYNQSDYELSWKNEAVLSYDKRTRLFVNLLSTAAHPSYQQQFMLSNHFVWENNFKQQLMQSASIAISQRFKKPSVYNAYYYTKPLESFVLKLNYTVLNNYLYYGKDARPDQLLTAESVLQLYGKKHFSLRKFQIQEELVYQTFSSGLKTKILLPEILSKTSIYFQSYAFKKAAFIQMGMDVSYTTSHPGKLYNPATRNFQISNNKVGNYPLMDVFINLEIKTARIFFKYDFINQDLMNTSRFPNYFYISPYQPSALRRFRLGFTWKFYY